MRKCLSTVLAIVFATTCGSSILLSSDYAVADDSRKAAKSDSKPSLVSVLGSLKWGMSSDKAKAIIAEKIMADFRTKSEGNSDLSYVDNLRKQHSDRVENMQKSLLHMARDNSASMGVSIIGEEFMPDAGESILMSREDNATKYYFFQNDKLYKLAVVYDSSYLGPVAFDTFCATTEQKYGKPVKEVWDDDGNFLESIWTEGDTKLTVKNKYAAFNTVLMVFANDSVEQSVAAKHKEYAASLNQGPEVSSAIDALTADSTDGNTSSVDAMLGKSTKVDLLAGLSKEDIDIINGVTTEKEIEKKKKAKAKKAAKDRKKDAKAKAGLEIF